MLNMMPNIISQLPLNAFNMSESILYKCKYFELDYHDLFDDKSLIWKRYSWNKDRVLIMVFHILKQSLPYKSILKLGIAQSYQFEAITSIYQQKSKLTINFQILKRISPK